jgi:C-terminal peptidase prc
LARWRTPIPAPASTLSCDQAKEIVRWAADHHGLGSRRKALPVETLGQALRDKIDPQRLLLTCGDERLLEAVAAAMAHKLKASDDCRFLEAWYRSTLEPAKARFQKNVAKVAATLNREKAPALRLPPRPLPPAKRCISDADSLERRVERIARRLMEEASPELLQSFGGSRDQYLSHTLHELVLRDLPDPVTAVAKGELAALDPFSNYLPAREFDTFYHELAGENVGLGVRVRTVPRGLFVDEVMPEGSAGKRGALKYGDVIEEVDGIALAELPPSRQDSVLLGLEGTAVELRVRRNGKLLAPIVLTRERYRYADGRVTQKSVVRNGKRLAVFTVPSFYGRGGLQSIEDANARSSSEDFEQLFVQAMKQKPDAVVLDLRGNPGGYLDEAVAMAGIFLGSKPVVGVVEPQQDLRVLRDELRKAPLYQGPLAVLVDGESASAAEVLAGALRDHERAVVVGAPRTFGKGSVQKLFPLSHTLLPIAAGPDAGGVKLTTSRFHAPMGESPAGKGLKPHWIAKALEQDSDDDRPTLDSFEPIAPFVDKKDLEEIEQRKKARESRLASLELLLASLSSKKTLDALEETELVAVAMAGGEPPKPKTSEAPSVAHSSERF